jgi:hypothetical protein
MGIYLLRVGKKQKTIIPRTTLLLTGLLLSACDIFQCNCYCSDYAAEELKLNDTACSNRSEIL